MSFDRRELFGELANKIGAEDITDPFELLKRGDEESQKGNHGKAKEFYEKAIATGKAKAERFESNNQHRSAAEMNYARALANLRLNKTEAAMALYSKIGTQLIEGGKNYIELYKEYQDGVILITLGGLVYVLQDRVEDAKNLYLTMINEIEQKGQTGEIQQGLAQLKETLWTVGYIIKAIQDVDHSALQSAQQLISKSIKPNLKKAKVAGMEPLLDEVVNYTLNYFQSQIKLPRIVIRSTIPPEMVANEIFEIKFDIENKGEGEANSLVMEMEFPNDLELVDGSPSVSYEKLVPNQQLTQSYSLRYQTSIEEDREFQLQGKLSYKDMLNNEQVQFIGPIPLEINAKSKKDEFTSILSDKLSKWNEMKEKGFAELIPSELVDSIQTLVDKTKSQIETLIENSQYEKAEAMFSTFDTILEWVEESIREGVVAKRLLDAIKKGQEAYAEEKVREAEEKHNQEMEKTIERINSMKEEEKQEALTKQEAELERKWKQEIENLKAEHQQELDNLKGEHEKQLKMKLIELEEALNEKHRKEIDEINEKNEKGIREIQQEYQNELETKVEEAKQQIEEKYEKQIKELKQSFEEEKRQLIERMTEEKENEIQSLTAKFEVEKEKLKQDLRNEFEEEKEQAINKALEEASESQARAFKVKENEYKEKIAELERRVARLESGE